MKRTRHLLLGVLTAVSVFAGPALRAAPVNFEREILPVLEAKCFSCHSSRKERPKGGLRLDSREQILQGGSDGKVLLPGHPDQSTLWTLSALSPDDEDAMPPPEKENPLTQAEQRKLRSWITEGAKFGKWTAYEHRAKSPATVRGNASLAFSIRDVEAAAKHIDTLIAKHLHSLNLPPNPPIPDEVFLRRIHLDVSGMIPSYREAAEFLNTTGPDRRGRLIDRLLASEGYAHHFLNYWADILRVRTKKDFKQYQDHLQSALRANQPYDRFVFDLLSATGVTAENGAVGYMRRDRDMPLDHTANTMQVFLGTQIGCAQCHDHPFDRWSQRDFYGMAAFIYGTKTTHPNHGSVVAEMGQRFGLDRKNKQDQPVLESLTSLVNYSGRRAVHNYGIDAQLKLPPDYQYEDAKPGDVVPWRVPFGQSPVLRGNEPPRTAFARWATSPENPRFARMIANRLWSKVMGRGIVEPIDDFSEDNKPSHPELLDFLTRAMIGLEFDMKAFLRMIYRTDAYQREVTREDLPPGQPYAFPGPVMQRMSAEQIWDSHLVLLMSEPLQRKNPKLAGFRAECPDYVSMPVEKLYALAKERPGLQMGRRFRKYLKEKKPLAHLEEPTVGTSSDHKKVPSHYHLSTQLEMPAKLGHFLREFGQSDRVSIEAASRDPSVPQMLTLLNGPLLDDLLGPVEAKSGKADKKFRSDLHSRLKTAKDPAKKLNILFLSLLARQPTPEEIELWTPEIRNRSERELTWVLLNSNEFMFIQ
jgi:hypothetical protein